MLKKTIGLAAAVAAGYALCAAIHFVRGHVHVAVVDLRDLTSEPGETKMDDGPVEPSSADETPAESQEPVE